MQAADIKPALKRMSADLYGYVRIMWCWNTRTRAGRNSANINVLFQTPSTLYPSVQGRSLVVGSPRICNSVYSKRPSAATYKRPMMVVFFAYCYNTMPAIRAKINGNTCNTIKIMTKDNPIQSETIAHLCAFCEACRAAVILPLFASDETCAA